MKHFPHSFDPFLFLFNIQRTRAPGRVWTIGVLGLGRRHRIGWAALNARVGPGAVKRNDLMRIMK